ncbi:MAG: AEC family transporter [Thermohalobaculum sp.]|nr:AEC family transporter [Thermohalobaculum sp.]
MLAQIFSITAPVFLLALAGFVWARRKAPFDLEFVTRLSLTFSVPCLIFATLVKAEIDPAAFRDIALASLAAYAAVTLATAPLLRLAGLSQRTWLAPVIFGNTGNVGLPVALFAYGDQGLALAMVIFAVMAILSFTVGIYMVAGVGRPSEALKQPLVYASILGGLFAVMDWELPDWLLSALGLAGQIAIPMMLLTLGVSIARLRAGDIGRAAVVSVAKYAICAAVALGTAHAVGLPAVATGVLFLQLVMPVAVTNYMLAARYQREPEAVAGLVVVSTVLSLAGIPVALAYLL